jgi:hypothetical protein
MRECDTRVYAVNQLVEEQLAGGEPAGGGYVGTCTLCGGDRHGEPVEHDALGGYRILGCPGAFADDEQREQWLNSWAYAVIQRERALDVKPLKIDDGDLLAPPLPQNMCPLRADELQDSPVDDTTVFDAGRLPPCPESSATNEQHRQWLWQCMFRLHCETILHEEALRCLGYHRGLSTRWDELLPCGERFGDEALR